MGRIALFLLLFRAASSYGQSSSDVRIFHNSTFNWSIAIPKGFEKVADSTWAKIQGKGTAAIESTYDAKVENHTKTIFVFKSDQFNYFESNYQPFDTAKDGNYQDVYKKVYDVLYGTLKAQMPMARLDTSYSREVIGGKEFNVFSLDAHINPQFTLHMLMYSRLFGKKEFSVNMMYVDPEKGKTLLEAWRSSSFDK